MKSEEHIEIGKCPKCNSTKIKFQRERVGSVGNSVSGKTIIPNVRAGSSTRQNIYNTVGVCQNCGYTWKPNETTTQSGKGCLWWLLMLFVWPIALSVWFYKTDKIKLEKKWKIIIIAAFWAFVIIFGGTSEETGTDKKDKTEITQNDVSSDDKEDSTEETEDTQISFNEQFINTYVPKGVPAIMREYKKLEEAGENETIRKLMYRNNQSDTSIPVLEEQTVSGRGLVIGANSYSNQGTTMVDLYLGSYDFDYKSGITPATEKLLAEHPEEWCNFVTIVSGDYMKVNRGDTVYFEGTIYGISNDIMSLRGTCHKE